MSNLGNYDITAITVTSNVNNTNSFNKVGEKYQFKGTPWNETSYVDNDLNSKVVFEENQGMKVRVNSRYINGLLPVANSNKNKDRDHIGVSFDLLDIFIKAASEAKLVDVDKEGFTDANKKAYGEAFDRLRQRKLREARMNPYSKEYTKMMNGTQFEFTADEIKELYEAAGFALAKKEEKKPAETEKDKPIDNTGKVDEKKTEEKKPKGGEFTLGTDDDFKSKDMKQETIKKVADYLGLKAGAPLEIDFGALHIDNDGEITEDFRFTYQGKQYAIQKGNIQDLQIVKQEVEHTEHEEEVKTQNGQTEKKNVDTRYNTKTGKYQERKQGTFLGLFHTHKWHDVVDSETGEAKKMPRSAAKRAENKQIVQNQVQNKPVQKTEAQTRAEFLENGLKMDAENWSKQKVINYWFVEDENVEIPSFASSTVQNQQQRAELEQFSREHTKNVEGNNPTAVILSDGTKAIRVEVPTSTGKEKVYYQPKVGRRYPTNELVYIPGEKIENAVEQ